MSKITLWLMLIPRGLGSGCLMCSCLLLFLLPPPLQADSPPLLIAAGSRIPVRSILDEFSSHNGLKPVLAEDIQAELEVHETIQLTYRQLLDQVLPANGFFVYHSPQTGSVILSRDLVERRFPLSREVNRGLRRAVAQILDSTHAATFGQALEAVLWGVEQTGDLVVNWPERSLRLSARPSELIVYDTRSRIKKIQEVLRGLGPQLARTPPAPLITETLPLERTTGKPFISALNESLFGGTGFDGHSWDGTPYLALNENSNVLVIGHTRAGIGKAREIADLTLYKVPEPPLELASRSYQTVPDKIRDSLSGSAAHQRELRVESVSKLLESMLYEGGNREEAAARGRVIIPHPETGTIDVIDTPENLQKIEDYLKYGGVSAARTVAIYGKPSWPQIRVIEVKHRAVDQMARALGYER